MSIDSSSPLPANVLLKVSACTTGDELSQVLSSLPPSQTLDAATIVHAVAECFDAQQLLRLIHDKTTDGLSPQPDNWVSACIERAENIDEYTGRIDWAIQWLEQVLLAFQKESETDTVDPMIQKTLDHAYSILAMQEAANDATLRQINAMDPSQFIDWLIGYAADQTQGKARVLESVLSRQTEYLGAWNSWWKRQLGLAPWHHELFRHLVSQCRPGIFSPEILLASVLSVAGPCNSAEYMETVAGLPFISNVPSGLRHSVTLVDRVARAAEIQGDTETLVDVLETLDKQTADQTKGAVLALVQAIRMMQNLGFDTSVHGLLAMQTSKEAQRRTLVRVVRSALQTTLAPDVSLWKTLLQLHDLSVFSAQTIDQIKHQYLSQLFLYGQLDQARDLIDAEPGFTEPWLERDAACKAARELIDGSESGDCGDMTLARSILTQTLSEEWRGDAEVAGELALIDASQLCATLRRPGDLGVVPAELRMAADAYAAVETVLQKCPAAYCRPRVVREIASLLLAKERGQGNNNRRAQSVSEALVCSLMLQSAVSAADHKAAYEFSRSLQGARSALASALLRGSPGNDGDKQAQQLVHRAVKSICAGCQRLAESWVDGKEGRRLETLALALRLSPAHELPGMLITWRRIASSSDWWSPTYLDATSVADSVRHLLLGSADKALPTETPVLDDDSVDVDAVRSFDPAIIRRCLRNCSGDGGSRRRLLLLEWLEFSLTTSTEPRTPRAVSFRHTLERTLVEEYAGDAIECLRTRVFPQIDQTNHSMVQGYYSFYARLGHALGNPGQAEQAEVRVELAAKLRLVRSLREVDFSRLVGALVSGDKDATALCGLADSVDDRMAMAETLVYDMALVRPMDADGPGSGVYWEAGELASAIASDVLMRLLDQQQGSEFIRCISACVPLMTVAEDRRALGDRVAFDGTAAALLGIDERQQVLALMRDQEAMGGRSRADVYVGFLARLYAARDPQDRVITRRAVWYFDTTHGVSLQSSTPATAVWQLLNEALQNLIAHNVCSAYFVLCAYQAAVELVELWDGQEVAVDRLDAVYSQAIGRVSDKHCLLDICKDVLGEDMPEETSGFKQRVAQTTRDIVYGTRAAACSLDAKARLELLDLCQGHCDNCDDRDMRMHLLADTLWGKAVPIAEIRDSKRDVWVQLLEAASKDSVRSGEQIDVLVEFLASITRDDDLADCVARLVVWAAKNSRPERVVVAMLGYRQYFGERAGARAFDELLGCVGEDPAMAPAVAILGMAYPVGLWAERCMEPVIMALLHEPAVVPGDTEDSLVVSTEEEEEVDGWGLDDDEDDVPVDDTLGMSKPRDEDYAAARKLILESTLLHVCIMLKGFVPATLASAELLDRVGQTCLWHHAVGDAEAMLLASVQGGMAELLRRTVHVLSDVGLDDLAVAWTQEFLRVPEKYRFAAGDSGHRWVGHLDCVVLGRSEAKQVDREEAGGYEPGWGESDVELELDHDEAPEAPVTSGSESRGEQKAPDATVERSPDAVETPRLADSNNVEEQDDAEAAGWGDDDDIDLDAELENMQ